jgi:hypothetical protein
MDGFVYRELATASDGYLTDPDSTILATVELWTPSGTSAVASATTDRGYYRLVVPSSGNYIVKVIGVDAALAGNRQTGILVLNKAKVSHVDFRFTA